MKKKALIVPPEKLEAAQHAVAIQHVAKQSGEILDLETALRKFKSEFTYDFIHAVAEILVEMNETEIDFQFDKLSDGEYVLRSASLCHVTSKHADARKTKH